MFIKPTSQYTTGDLYIPVANRHKVIVHALATAGYTVKPHVHTYPPGQAAVLPRVIIATGARTW